MGDADKRFRELRRLAIAACGEQVSVDELARWMVAHHRPEVKALLALHKDELEESRRKVIRHRIQQGRVFDDPKVPPRGIFQ